MPAYAVFELTFDREATAEQLAAYDQYRAEVVALVEAHGGTYLARAWDVSTLEGRPAGDRCHVVEFPDGAAARSFWEDPAYLALTPLRAGVVDVRAILVEPR